MGSIGSSWKLGHQVGALIEHTLDDRELRAKLESLVRKPEFDGLTWLWGPKLYARNKVLFRPFILAHFSEWSLDARGRWAAVRWEGERAEVLQTWLEQVDREDDVPLFRRLAAWKHRRRSGWGLDEKQWIRELVGRFESAGTVARRAVVLHKYAEWFTLTEADALRLYRIDRATAAPFILEHLPLTWWGGKKRSLWEALHDAALQTGDQVFAEQLYRRQIPLDRWKAEVLALADASSDPAALDTALEARHPQGHGLDLGGVLFELLVRRGRDVVPYIVRHLRDVWSHWYRSGYDKMVDLARGRGWLDLWGALVRTCARDKEFSREVQRVLDDRGLDDEAAIFRLSLLAGVSREHNAPGWGLAQVHSLEDTTAVALYDRFPELVRGPFKLHVEPTWTVHYPRLLDRLIERGDEPAIDRLASRYLTRVDWGYGQASEAIALAERLSHHYEALAADEAVFARRAAAVLTLVPAYAIPSYRRLVRTNRLARLLFTRSERAYLASPPAVRDLVEGSEIHVQALAYRIVALDDERARELARETLDILQGTLLRPLHRKTRIAAFAALRNAASTPTCARAVLRRAREALELPDLRYPKEQLVGLIGHILAHHPELRGPREQPIVHGAQEARS